MEPGLGLDERNRYYSAIGVFSRGGRERCQQRENRWRDGVGGSVIKQIKDQWKKEIRI